MKVYRKNEFGSQKVSQLSRSGLVRCKPQRTVWYAAFFRYTPPLSKISFGNFGGGPSEAERSLPARGSPIGDSGKKCKGIFWVKAQTFIDYAALIAIIAASLITMGSYVLGAMNARVSHLKQDLNSPVTGVW